MGKTKTQLELYKQSNSDLIKQNEALRKENRDYKELLAFINSLNKLCMKNQYTFCGIQQIPEGGFIGFVLESRVAIEPNTFYRYNLYGYTYQNEDKMRLIYNAHFEQYDEPAYAKIEKHLFIQDHYVDDKTMKGKGIGSAGMNMAKELAKHLRCAYISGNRMAKPNTKEEREKLYRFYEKNGFQQSQDEDNLCIKYNMQFYEKEKEQKERT